MLQYADNGSTSSRITLMIQCNNFHIQLITTLFQTGNIDQSSNKWLSNNLNKYSMNYLYLKSIYIHLKLQAQHFLYNNTQKLRSMQKEKLLPYRHNVSRKKSTQRLPNGYTCLICLILGLNKGKSVQLYTI